MSSSDLVFLLSDRITIAQPRRSYVRHSFCRALSPTPSSSRPVWCHVIDSSSSCILRSCSPSACANCIPIWLQVFMRMPIDGWYKVVWPTEVSKGQNTHAGRRRGVDDLDRLVVLRYSMTVHILRIPGCFVPRLLGSFVGGGPDTKPRQCTSAGE